MKRINNTFNQQIKNIQSETNNPTIVNDVVRNDLEQYTGNEQSLNGSVSAIEEERVKNPVDGKTWNSIK